MVKIKVAFNFIKINPAKIEGTVLKFAIKILN